MDVQRQAQEWLSRRMRDWSDPIKNPERLGLELQEQIFSQMSADLLEREAEFYLARLRMAQIGTAEAVASGIWICGDDTFNPGNLCPRFLAEIERLKSIQESSPQT